LKKLQLFVCAAFLLLGGRQAFAQQGPLIGKNLFIPYLIHYSFPSLPAQSGDVGTGNMRFSFYYVNDVQYVIKGKIPTDNIVRDYESAVLEAGVSYWFTPYLEAGVDTRLVSYFGGFADGAIEWFHNLFGFPNAGRESFERNKLYIHIPINNPNAGGKSLFLEKAAVSLGDTDFWAKWTFFESPFISLAGLGAFKLPTGSPAKLSGSGSPDLGLLLAADFRPWNFMTFYTQAGVVLPFDGYSYPMFNGMLGIEYHPWKVFSFNVQMNVKTSPISNDIPWGWNPHLMAYSLPQMNILGGFTWGNGKNRWQFYFEEDAIFNQGTDLTLNFSYSRRF
jgi:hypothetical protein